MNKEAKLRVLLYASIAVLSTLMTRLQELSVEIIASMIWVDWTVIAIAPVLSALVAVRAFLDQSMSRDYRKQTPINMGDIEKLKD